MGANKRRERAASMGGAPPPRCCPLPSERAPTGRIKGRRFPHSGPHFSFIDKMTSDRGRRPEPAGDGPDDNNRAEPAAENGPDGLNRLALSANRNYLCTGRKADDGKAGLSANEAVPPSTGEAGQKGPMAKSKLKSKNPIRRLIRSVRSLFKSKKSQDKGDKEDENCRKLRVFIPVKPREDIAPVAAEHVLGHPHSKKRSIDDLCVMGPAEKIIASGTQAPNVLHASTHAHDGLDNVVKFVAIPLLPSGIEEDWVAQSRLASRSTSLVGLKRHRSCQDISHIPLDVDEGIRPEPTNIVTQVFALISAIYQPQNAYCIAVDERAEEKFKEAMNLLGDCLPNVFVMSVSKVEWCQFGVVRGVFSCVRYLSELAHPWRYYQYLSGVDLPLKTNLEMVRIFKRLNGTVNAEVLPFEIGRIKGPQMLMKLPLTLWKSSLSALVSREAVDAMVRSEKVRQLMRYLQFGYCQDEALWATMAGNPKELPIPGGFDATYIYGRLFKEAYLSQIQQNQREHSMASVNNSNGKDESELAAEPFQLATYYISRYQVWRETNLLSGSRNTKCNGTFVSHSCVFGISDLPSLVRRPEMMVHKMYLDFQPAAYFCLWKTIHERALDWRNQQKFQGRIYSELPMVKIARGAAEEELKFFFDL